MARDTEKRRAELREKLIDIAETRIEVDGMRALKARAVAEEAGCAVGAIYNVFEDMNGLILAVNVRTFGRLGRSIIEAVVGHEMEPPFERLALMSTAYVDFACDNINLWRALFDIEMTADSDIPDWYMDELGNLFKVISSPLAEADPTADPEEVDLRTRALFSAVHGIMLLSLENRLSGVPRAHLKDMVAFLLRSVTLQPPLQGKQKGDQPAPSEMV